MRLACLLVFSLLCCGTESPVRPWVQSHRTEILKHFVDLLAVPNVASDGPGIARNAQILRGAMEQRGIRTQMLEMAGVPPVLYGEITSPSAKRTLIFYAHYDGQPVDLKDWTASPPFQPTLRKGRFEDQAAILALSEAGSALDPEWRLYARSASDDKAAILAMLAALDALKQSHIALSSNLKFVFEGEEEAGSPHLQQIVHDHADLLRGDVWLICDGPVSQNRQQQVYFGARGISGVEITVYGPNHELHSGHYGNWAPNPAMMLARLLTTMKSENGKVLIDGFYDGIEPLSAAERQALREHPRLDDDLRKELGIGWTEGAPRSLVELIHEPSLNINGLHSAAVGAQARNVIPSVALASIDCRLVKGMDPKHVFDLVVQHVRKQGYTVATDPATKPHGERFARVIYKGGYASARTSMDLPISRQVVAAIADALGPVVRLPALGGSVPLYIFEQELHTPMIGIPIANHDNNQHSANENIRLQNLWDGIETMAALMTMR